MKPLCKRRLTSQIPCFRSTSVCYAITTTTSLNSCLEFLSSVVSFQVILGHTLCEECVESGIENNRLECKICGKVIDGVQDIQQVPVNHIIFDSLAKKNQIILGNQKTFHDRVGVSTENVLY